MELGNAGMQEATLIEGSTTGKASRVRPAPTRRSPPGAWLTLGLLMAMLLAGVGLSRFAFGLDYMATAVALDGLLLAGLMLVLRPALRGPWAAAGVAACAVFLFVVAHAAKFAMLGTPVLAADVPAGLMLLRVLSGWRLALALAGGAVFLALLAWSVLPRRRSAAWALGALGYLGLLFTAASPIASLGQQWVAVDQSDRLAVLTARGGLMFLLQDWSNLRSEQLRTVDEADIAALVAGTAWRLPGQAPSSRNIHVVLLETLWDPTRLDHYAFSRHPFDERFVDLWERGGRSTVLVPTFGGATANSEFEALCGLQVNSNLVAFSTTLRQAMPCLPSLLQAAGYRTVASHPNSADFWARDRVYQWVGFERYLAVNAFELDDMDGAFLADASLFRQQPGLLAASDDGRPVFNYVVTLGSHFPYGRDVGRRPDRVEVSPSVPLLAAYANAVAYTTEAFMDWVEATLEADPDALIVAFGDHAPVLGSHPDPLERGGLGIRSDLPKRAVIERYRALASTPLLVINGRQGVVDVGEPPLYALPGLILGWLGRDDLRLPQDLPIFRPGEGLRPRDDFVLRSFLGSLLVRERGQWELCPMAPPAFSGRCERALAQLEKQRQVRFDLVRGRQHLIRLSGAERLLATAPMVQEVLHDPCGVDVVAWGPQEVAAGQAFNRQDDGTSALWLHIEGARAPLHARLGGVDVEMVVNGQAGSASFDHEALALAAGPHPLEILCSGRVVARPGELVVVAPEDAMPAPDGGGAAAACDIALVDHGPRQVVAGEAFNLQPDGRSALWFSLEGDGGAIHVEAGGRRRDVAVSPGLATMSVDGDLLGGESIDLSLSCNGRVFAEVRIPVQH